MNYFEYMANYLGTDSGVYLADYGIDLASVALSGQKVTTVYGTKKMWEEINGRNNIVLLSDFLDGYLRITPAMTTHADGITTSVAFQVLAIVDGAMLTLSIVLGSTWDTVNGYGNETTITCVTTQTAL